MLKVLNPKIKSCSCLFVCLFFNVCFLISSHGCVTIIQSLLKKVNKEQSKMCIPDSNKLYNFFINFWLLHTTNDNWQVSVFWTGVFILQSISNHIVVRRPECNNTSSRKKASLAPFCGKKGAQVERCIVPAHRFDILCRICTLECVLRHESWLK